MQYNTILVTDQDRIRTITLNRPERRNAMSPGMQLELLFAMQEAAGEECRVLVFRGAGHAFCSGLDLSVLQELADQSADEHRTDAERVGKLLRTLYELPMPTIAAVHGPAIAGGTGLATLCDFTLAVPAAKFGYTEARIGFVPALVACYLRLQIGDKLSRNLLLTGRLFDAEEAYRLGLVSEIVPPDQLSSRVAALARTLIANSPTSLAATKRLLAAQNKEWLDAALAEAMEANTQSRTTPEFREGISAFLEKRQPFWNAQ